MATVEPFAHHGGWMSFFRSGRDRNQYCFVDTLCDISLWKVNIVITKIILDVFACPGLGCYFWGFTNNYTQPTERMGEDDFPQPFTSFSPFKSDTSLFENVEFPQDVKSHHNLLPLVERIQVSTHKGQAPREFLFLAHIYLCEMQLRTF